MRIPIVLAPGLTSNNTPFSTQGSFRSADKVRFIQGRAEVIGGWERASNKYVPGVCRTVLPWRDNVGAPLIAYATHQGLYVARSAKFADITPTGLASGNVDGLASPGWGGGGWGKGPWGIWSGTGDYRARTWSMGTFGQSLIACPRGGSIYWWQNDLTQKAVALQSVTGANNVPTQVNHIIVTPARQLVALGCSQAADGVFNPRAIRCSDVDGNIQDWHITRSNNADEIVLDDAESIIMGGKLWSEQVLAVWTLNDLYAVTYVGNPDQVYRSDRLSGGAGLIGPNASVVVGGGVFWIAPDLHLWSCGLNGVPQMVECPIALDTLSNIAPGQGDKVVLSYLTATNEIRIDYPDIRYGKENNRYVLFHLSDSVWSQGAQVRTAFVGQGPYQWPIGVDTQTLSLPVPGSDTMTDNTTAAAVLGTAQANIPTMKGTNLVLKANASATTALATTTTPSLWAFQWTGNGSTAHTASITGLGLTLASRVSISYTAQVLAGPNVTLGVNLHHATPTVGDDLATTVTVTGVAQRFKHENILVQSTADAVQFSFPTTLANGVIVQVADVKVEVAATATDWAPSPLEPALYTNYATWLKSLTYTQIVGRPYYHERGNADDGGPLSWFIETNDFALDDELTSMIIKEVIPDFGNQQGDVKLTVFLRQYPKDPNEYAVGPFVIGATDDRVDLLETGKIARFRLEGTSAPAFMRLGRMIFDVVRAGNR